MLDNGRMLPPGEMASFWYLGDRFCPALYSNHELASRRFWVDISYYFCFFASKVKKNKTLLMIRFSFFREAPPCPTQVVFLCNGRSCYNYLTFSSSFFSRLAVSLARLPHNKWRGPPSPPLSFDIIRNHDLLLFLSGWCWRRTWHLRYFFSLQFTSSFEVFPFDWYSRKTKIIF